MIDCRTTTRNRSTQPAQSTAPTAQQIQALHTELTHCLVAINACNALLTPLPPHTRCSFTLLLYTQQQQQDESDSHWLPIDVTAAALSAHSTAVELPLIVPLRSTRTALLDVEVYVEESASKGGSHTDNAETATIIQSD